MRELHVFRVKKKETELFRRQKPGKATDNTVEQIRLTLSAGAADEQMRHSYKVDDQFLILRSHAEINRQQHPLLIFRIEGFRPNVAKYTSSCRPSESASDPSESASDANSFAIE